MTHPTTHPAQEKNHEPGQQFHILPENECLVFFSQDQVRRCSPANGSAGTHPQNIIQRPDE